MDSKPVARFIVLNFNFIFLPGLLLFTAAFGIDALAVLGQMFFASGQFVTRLPRMTYDIYRSLAAQDSSKFSGSDIVLWYNGRAGAARRIISYETVRTTG